MSVTVDVAAESKKLTTKEAVQELLNIVGTDDTLIDNLIDRVSAAIVLYCGREFAQQTYTETLTSIADYDLIVRHTPIVSVSLITLDGDTVPADDYTLQDPEPGFIFNKNFWDWTGAEQLYSVTYIAGYILPSFTSGTKNLPKDVEMAAIESVKAAYLGRAADPTSKSEMVPEVYSVSRSVGGSNSIGITDSSRLLLDAYKRYTI